MEIIWTKQLRLPQTRLFTEQRKTSVPQGSHLLGDCETLSANDEAGQSIQKRAPMRWQVALILYRLPILCFQKASFAIAYTSFTTIERENLKGYEGI